MEIITNNIHTKNKPLETIEIKNLTTDTEHKKNDIEFYSRLRNT